MKRAALRGLIFGLIMAFTVLIAPLAFKLGMWAHSKVDPPEQNVVWLDVR